MPVDQSSYVADSVFVESIMLKVKLGASCRTPAVKLGASCRTPAVKVGGGFRAPAVRLGASCRVTA